MPGDIERALWCIVKAMKARNYREAGDLYVRVAIGNAAWPIGVTMVGIHERAHRSKITETIQSGAHVMQDEQTRKYLQSVKRLITFAQRKYPTAPSLSLEFNSLYNGSDKEARARARSNTQRRPLERRSVPRAEHERRARAAQALLAAERQGLDVKRLALESGAIPESYQKGPDGRTRDGWRANDDDIRTWGSVIKGAYGEYDNKELDKFKTVSGTIDVTKPVVAPPVTL